MKEKDHNPKRRRLKTSYFSTIISISLVLFMLGMLGLILLNAKNLSDYVKENIGFSLYLQDDIDANELSKLQRSLENRSFVKSISYTNKEEAAELLKADLGEDFVEFLGYNPLSASIDVYLKAEYAEIDSVKWITADLKRLPFVKEIVYQEDLISEVNTNARKISAILLTFSLLLFVVVVALINNTIRLAIYSKRFLIKTMQLVGATPAFIRKPFVVRGILNGIASAFIAIILLMGVIYSVQQNLPELVVLQDISLYLILFSSVVLLGILISWISTSLAVRKFLRIQSGDLY